MSEPVSVSAVSVSVVSAVSEPVSVSVSVVSEPVSVSVVSVVSEPVSVSVVSVVSEPVSVSVVLWGAVGSCWSRRGPTWASDEVSAVVSSTAVMSPVSGSAQMWAL